MPVPLATSARPTTKPTTKPTPVTKHSPATSTAYSVTYGFNRGADDLAAGLHGSPPLSVKSAAGGTLRTTKHGTGDAIGFPALCAHPESASCPRVILETNGDVSHLNPGSGRIRCGATVKMRSDQASDGQNIVQKGLPSCAVVGVSSSTIYLAKSSVAIDDGAWHSISCDLHGGVLSITVDGTVRGKRNVPNALVVSNSDELRIGGKGTSTNNDQFNGELDDAWVTVGS